MNDREELASVCAAALAYDQAIRRHAANTGTHTTHDDGSTTVCADDLDDLYMDWMDKAERALERIGREAPK
jgi:hypothetical protein